MLGKKEMKQLVRENFKEDRNNELLGFLEVENTIEADYPADYTQAGAVLVYYRAHTGEITCELLDDMVGELLNTIRKNVFFTGTEARRLAEGLVEGMDVYELIDCLELSGMPRVLAEDVVESVMSSDFEEDNVFEEFLDLLNEYTTIQW